MEPERPLIERLHGLRLPPPPAEPLWPLDWQSSLLAVAVGIGIGLLVLTLARWLRRRRPTGLAAACRSIAALPEGARLPAYARLLREAAGSGSASPAVRRLSGSEWLAWLDAQTGRTFFRDGAGKAFGDALYRPGATADWAALERTLPEVLASLARGRHAGA